MLRINIEKMKCTSNVWHVKILAKTFRHHYARMNELKDHVGTGPTTAHYKPGASKAFKLQSRS